MYRDPGYPDDIRQYDNDPRSPFYNGPERRPDHELEEEELAGIRHEEVADYLFECQTEGNLEKQLVAAFESDDAIEYFRLLKEAFNQYTADTARYRVAKSNCLHVEDYNE